MAVKKAKAGEKVNKLTEKQRKFVQFYSGNATEAARLAGYKGNRYTLGVIANENLNKPYIAEAIRERTEKQDNPKIMKREERQAFWSEVARSSESDMKDRLKASELLGKSEGDFLDRVKLSGDVAEPVRFVIEGDSG